MKEHFARKTILITGAAGSVGQELVRQLQGLGEEQEEYRQLTQLLPPRLPTDLKTHVG